MKKILIIYDSTTKDIIPLFMEAVHDLGAVYNDIKISVAKQHGEEPFKENLDNINQFQFSYSINL